MKKWVQKSIVIMVAFLTFGLITPTHEIWDAFDQNSSNRAAIGPSSGTSTAVAAEPDSNQDEDTELYQEAIDYGALLMDAAKEQSYIKFGTKIGPKISNEFDAIIFPKMEEAIAMTVASLDDGSLASLAITERPSGNYGEKIFNITNSQTGSDLIRFHVRTEKRPQEGYYYNFHYHSAEDDFMAHNNLGDIYWEKNTPPKWLS
ncbi:YpjP family protein [Lysinibacillus parviboronicapiens]|uniref:YpjP family protein n=1 Tax=Lysinibacillus parviboronicapiens TaxID=436516 RepID=UPI000D3608EA|nr:YpjP family protein [Lysinibacillus parviboronicapiens]